MWLSSSLLEQAGFHVHGFSTRAGGVSEGPFASWNFSSSTGDTLESVEANFHILAERLDVSREQVFGVHQVHSAKVVVLDSLEQVTHQIQADALLSFVPEAVVGVKTADCVPVLMADPKSRAVAAIHAGWRGVVAEIVPATLRLLRERLPDSEPVFAIGPHIQAHAFQVGPEVIEHFPDHHRPDPSIPHRYLVDLDAVLREQLGKMGVVQERIQSLGDCTLTDVEERFFSHRRHKGKCGRMFNFISGK